jgi:outer membrane lipoprotein
MHSQVDTALSFEDLVHHPEDSIGLNVILGGYVLEVTNRHEKTTLMLLQAPLGFQDQPGQRDRSKGRLIVEYPGFLDPAVYGEDRKVTVGGRILEGGSRGEEGAPYPFLRIAAAEVHLWPVPKTYPHPDPWWDYPPHYRYYGYPWHPHFYRYRHW